MRAENLENRGTLSHTLKNLEGFALKLPKTLGLCPKPYKGFHPLTRYSKRMYMRLQVQI